AGPALLLRDFGGGSGRRRQHAGDRYGARKPHSTVMEAEAVSEKPLSPTHSNSNLPLSVTDVKKLKKGLAAMAGNRSARKISAPLKRQMKFVMIARGSGLPARALVK